MYQVVALAAVVRQLLRRDPAGGAWRPRVSILKPVHGRDRFLDEAIRSHLRLDYPRYELHFAVGSEDDPAVKAVRALEGVHLHVRSRNAPNAKAASLAEMARHASGEIWVVNDGDIRVTRDYLKRIVPPLDDERVGLVTCLYRPVPVGWPAMWEALGIATDFAPSTLVAPLVGIDEFGLGSTLCFRAADLWRVGGFEAIGDYLADDYQLAARLTRGLGKRAWMSRYVVDTGLEYSSWRGMWRHQVRWARTIRRSRFEYVGLPVTHAGLWALIAWLCGFPGIAVGLVALRILAGVTAGGVLLRTPVAWALPLIPVWDVFAFAVWVMGLTGTTIEWRGQRMKLTSDGRLIDGNRE